MASPSTAINRFDLSMTYQEFNLLANIKKFIGLLVLPAIAVEQEGASFARIKIASLLTKIEDTLRAPKTTYAEGDYEWDQDSYAVGDHGVTETVDDATVEKYGDILRVERISSMRAINRVLQRLEYDIAAAVTDTAIWTGASLTTAIATPFSTKTTADPLAVFDAAYEKVSSGSGSDPNTIVLTKKDFVNMIRTDRLEGLLKYDASGLLVAMNSGQNQNMVTDVMSGLKDLLNVERILVGRGFKNTADNGQPPSMSRVWPNGTALMCVVQDDGIEGDLENPMPQLGRTIFSSKNSEPLPGANDSGVGSIIMEEYRTEEVRGGKIRGRNKRGIKILQKECSHMLTGL